MTWEDAVFALSLITFFTVLMLLGHFASTHAQHALDHRTDTDDELAQVDDDLNDETHIWRRPAGGWWGI